MVPAPPWIAIAIVPSAPGSSSAASSCGAAAHAPTIAAAAAIAARVNIGPRDMAAPSRTDDRRLDAGAAKLGRRGDRGKGARSAQPHVVDVELELAGLGPAGEDDGHDVLAVDAERGPGQRDLAPFAARLERPRDRHHARSEEH